MNSSLCVCFQRKAYGSKPCGLSTGVQGAGSQEPACVGCMEVGLLPAQRHPQLLSSARECTFYFDICADPPSLVSLWTHIYSRCVDFSPKIGKRRRLRKPFEVVSCWETEFKVSRRRQTHSNSPGLQSTLHCASIRSAPATGEIHAISSVFFGVEIRFMLEGRFTAVFSKDFVGWGFKCSFKRLKELRPSGERGDRWFQCCRSVAGLVEYKAMCNRCAC